MSEPSSTPSPDNTNSTDPSGAGAEALPGQAATPPPGPVLPEKPRKRRRWRWVAGVCGVLLLLIALLIVLAPTLASMGWARAIVVEQINKNLNGRVEIADYSLSWTGGLKASGIRVYDAENALIAEVGSASTQLSLLDALRGRYNCGQTAITGVGFTYKQFADGSTNFERLLKRPTPPAAAPAQSPTTPPAETAPEKPAPTPPAKPAEPAKLPPVRVHLVLSGWHGVVERDSTIAGKTQVVNLDRLDADVNVTDINAPIDHSLTVVARMGNGASQGTFTEKGTLGVIQNNQIDPSTASIKESLALVNFDLGGAAPFLPASVRELSGVASGNIDIDVANGKSGTVGAALDVRKPTITLAAFNDNESLPLDRLSLVLPQPTTIDLSAGMEHWADWVFKVGDGHAGGHRGQITVFAEKDGVKLLNLTVAANVTPGRILDLAANRIPASPGAAGRIEVIAHADAGKLCQLLPKTMALKNGVELTSAPVQYTLSADFSPASAALNQVIDLGGVKGRNTVEKRDLSIEPFHLSFKGTTFGGGWKMPDLRDLALIIHHGQGINADFQGAALTSINGTMHLKPRDILAEVGQFVDMGNRQADGDVTVTAKAQGDLLGVAAGADPSKPAVNNLLLQLAARGFKLQGFVASDPGATLAQQFVGVDISGEVERNRTSGQVEAVKGLTFAARAGDEAHPNVVADLQAKLVTFGDAVVTDPMTGKSSTIRVASIPEFKADKLGIADLKLAQTDFGAFLPFLKNIRIDHGSVSLAGTSGSYDGARNTTDFGAFPRLDELKAVELSSGSTSPPVEIVSGYSLVAAVGGKVSSDNGTTRVALSNLSITDSPQWLNIAKTGDGPLEFIERPDGTLAARGGIKLAVELAPFNDIARKLASPTVELTARAGHPMKLTSGRLEGTIALASARADAIGVSVDLDATSLTVSGDGPGVNDESLRIVLRASASDDFSQLAVTRLDATGSVVTAHVPDAVVWLKSGSGKDARAVPVLQMLRKLSATLDVPDAGKLQTVVDSLSPASAPLSAAQPPSGSSAAPPPVRAKLTAGSFAVKLDVTNKDNQLTLVPDLQGKGLAFAAGAVKYKLGDITVKGKAIVVANPAATAIGPDGQPTPVLRQISQLLIPELLATGAGSTIALAGQPIVIQDPADLGAAFASAANGAPASGPSVVPPGKSPSINAGISVVVDLRSLSDLANALAGRPPAPTYLATGSFRQTFTTRNGVIQLLGKGSLQNFTVLGTDHKTPTFSEKNVAVDDDLSLDGTHGPAVLSIGKLRLAMESSKALDLSVSGSIHDLSGQRVMDHVIADVTYDGEQLTPILRSMLAPAPTPADPNPVDRFKDLRMAGHRTERFAIWGSYPANQPFDQAIASLSASGALAVDFLDTMGLDIQKLQVPVWLDHGVVKLAPAPGTAPATIPATGPADALATTALCNSGTINLSGITLDLAAPSALLTVPPETKVLDNVALNNVLAATANTYLPIFDDKNASSGRLSFIVHHCDRMPLDELTTEIPGKNASMDFSTPLADVQLGGKIVDAIEKLGVNNVRSNLRGDIPDARFQLGAGQLTIQKFNLLGGKNKLPILTLTGKVGLSSDGRMNLVATVPPKLLSSIIRDKNLLEFLPNIDFPITGTKSAPRPELDKALKKALGDAAKKALLKGVGGNLLKGLGGKSGQ